MSVGPTCLSTTACVLQDRDVRLLTDLYGHAVLTRDQIIRLGHFGSVQRCNARLLRLRQGGYIQLVEHPAVGGASPSLYRVGRQAVGLLADHLGLAADELQRTISASAAVTYLEHTIQLTDVRLAFEQAVRHDAVDPFLWRGEGLCRHVYSVGDLRRIIKPDAFLRLGQERWFVEFDLGNASQDALSAKLVGYVNYLSDGAYQEVYGEPRFGLLLITTGPERLIRFLHRNARAPFPILATSRLLLHQHGPFAPIWSSEPRELQSSVYLRGMP